MKEPRGIRDRIVAVFLLGALLFNLPLLVIFNDATTAVFGIPLLYVYLFVAWIGLIALMALTTRNARGDGG